MVQSPHNIPLPLLFVLYSRPMTTCGNTTNIIKLYHRAGADWVRSFCVGFRKGTVLFGHCTTILEPDAKGILENLCSELPKDAGC